MEYPSRSGTTSSTRPKSRSNSSMSREPVTERTTSGICTFKGHGQVSLVNPIVLQSESSRQPCSVVRLRSFFHLSLVARALPLSHSFSLSAERSVCLAPADTWTKIYASRDFATRGSLVQSADTSARRPTQRSPGGYQGFPKSDGHVAGTAWVRVCVNVPPPPLYVSSGSVRW